MQKWMPIPDEQKTALSSGHLARKFKNAPPGCGAGRLERPLRAFCGFRAGSSGQFELERPFRAFCSSRAGSRSHFEFPCGSGAVERPFRTPLELWDKPKRPFGHSAAMVEWPFRIFEHPFGFGAYIYTETFVLSFVPPGA